MRREDVTLRFTKNQEVNLDQTREQGKVDRHTGGEMGRETKEERSNE